MILRQSPPTWGEAKKHLAEQDFINQLVNFDKDHISDKTLKKISAYCAQEDFMPEVVGKVSDNILLFSFSSFSMINRLELIG